MVGRCHAHIACAHSTESLVVAKTLISHLRMMIGLVHLDRINLNKVSSVNHVHSDHGGSTSGRSTATIILRHITIRVSISSHVGHIRGALLMVEVEQLNGIYRHRMSLLIEQVADGRLIIICHHVIHACLALAT